MRKQEREQKRPLGQVTAAKGPRVVLRARKNKRPGPFGPRRLGLAPGSDLLSHGLSHTTIGAGAFHFRVRDGIGWDHAAVSAREAVQVARLRGLRIGLGRNKIGLSHPRRCAIEDYAESQCAPCA